MSADSSLAKRLLGWSPKIDFAEGLRRTVAWYREFSKEFCHPQSALSRLAGQWG
jgi:dTDP-D-glucose 4,6-dehydratase